jgi:hypothetical protein
VGPLQSPKNLAEQGDGLAEAVKDARKIKLVKELDAGQKGVI